MSSSICMRRQGQCRGGKVQWCRPADACQMPAASSCTPQRGRRPAGKGRSSAAACLQLLPQRRQRVGRRPTAVSCSCGVHSGCGETKRVTTRAGWACGQRQGFPRAACSSRQHEPGCWQRQAALRSSGCFDDRQSGGRGLDGAAEIVAIGASWAACASGLAPAAHFGTVWQQQSQQGSGSERLCKLPSIRQRVYVAVCMLIGEASSQAIVAAGHSRAHPSSGRRAPHKHP